VRDATTRAVIVDFGSKDVLGLHSGEDVYIAKEVTQDFGKLAMVLVHEFAHDSGADGSKSHTDAIQSLSEALVNQLWRQIPA
jgi:hypothetical protein